MASRPDTQTTLNCSGEVIIKCMNSEWDHGHFVHSVVGLSWKFAVIKNSQMYRISSNRSPGFYFKSDFFQTRLLYETRLLNEAGLYWVPLL